MKQADVNFNIENINSVELNLLDGQVELILRALELYGYNLDYMLNSYDSKDDLNQEKKVLLKYTYEQILATQAEQVKDKANNVDILSNFGKRLINGGMMANNDEMKFNVI